MNLSLKLFAGLTIGAAIAAIAAAALAGDKNKPEKAETTAAKVGETAPDFTLTDTEGKQHTLSQYRGRIVVLEWFNSGCPYVQRHHVKYSTMADTARKYGEKVVWLAINSGAPGEQGHGKDKEAKADWKIAYPILNDETGRVGRMYAAKTTPHMYVIDANGVLQYVGAIDNDRGDERSPGEKVNYVAQAIDEILAGKPVSQKETKPYGCSVKYGKS